MSDLRLAWHYATRGGRVPAVALAAWTVGGAVMLVVAIAIVLALEPVQ